MTKPISKNNLKRLPFVFQVDASKFNFGEAPKEIQILMCGSWNHPCYGPLVIGTQDITKFKQNFDSGLRRDIPITEGHECGDEKPAIAWIRSLSDKGANGLWATVEWTAKGQELLADKAYKYFSPEFYSEYEDPETRAIYEDVLVGGALTNKPYFKSLQAVVLSEHNFKNYQLFNEKSMLIEILKKDPSALSAEEKAELVASKDQLSAEDLAKFGSVIEEASKPAETDAEKTAREDKEKGDANEAAGLNRDGSAKAAPTELTAEQKAANVAAGKNEDGSEKIEAREPKINSKGMIEVDASEFKALQSKANAGWQASEEMRKRDVKTQANALTFSEGNSKGKVLPKHEAKLFTFMLGLTASQRKEFSEIVNEIPTSQLFGEKGNGGNNGGNAYAEVEATAKKLMSENKGMKYADAVKKIFKENKDLATRYDNETAGK
jgi:phage I-like protein